MNYDTSPPIPILNRQPLETVEFFTLCTKLNFRHLFFLDVVNVWAETNICPCIGFEVFRGTNDLQCTIKIRG